MDIVRLGLNGPMVSRIGLGTMMMGWRISYKNSLDMLALAMDRGINFLDSSVSYARGNCHQILGRSIQSLGARSQVVLASKVGGISREGDPSELVGVNSSNILRQCELSLKQLKTDYIDLLQLHLADDAIPLEDQMGALESLRKKGHIRFYGVCNYSIKQLRELVTIVTRDNYSGFVSHQFSYNLLEQSGRENILEQCESCGIGSIIWGPLASGLLTDNYSNRSTIALGTRIDVGRERNEKLMLLKNPKTQEILRSMARRRMISGATIQQQAVSWLSKNQKITSILIGPSNMQQLLELIPD
jgi:aryl-alcohol dehydrogenase-like predicted oxidoreductase